MSYYLSALPACRCGKPATVELRNIYNASCGRFCKVCGTSRLKALERESDKANKRGIEDVKTKSGSR